MTIRIEIESGGKRMIRVIDDGHGMTHDDSLLAFERHATSKLRSADDLLSIATLGFRGEALPTIAAVSRLLLESRDAAEAEGTRIEFANGKLISVKPAGLPAGTTLSVADLFYSMPARRKFLKSDTTELGHIASLVTHYALANPDKQFVLSTPTQTIIDCPPVEKLADRVYQLFGRQALDELVEIPAVAAPLRSAITEPALDAEEEKATLTISGFTSRPEIQRPNRNGIYIFVNKRLVRDRLILHAIHEGVPKHPSTRNFPSDSAFPGNAVRRSGCQCSPGKNRSAFPPLAICSRRHAGRDSPGAYQRAPNRQLRRRCRNGRATAAAKQSFFLDWLRFLTCADHSRSIRLRHSARRNSAPGRKSVLGRGAGSDGGFDLSSAPMQPLEQRFAFEPGSSFSGSAGADAPLLALPLPAASKLDGESCRSKR